MLWLALIVVAQLPGEPGVTPAPAAVEDFAISPNDRLAFNVPFALPRTEVIERLGYLLSYWKRRFHVDAEWRGDRVFITGTVYGITVRAYFAVNDADIIGVAQDPGWVWREQGRIYVERKLKKYLHPTYDDP